MCATSCSGKGSWVLGLLLCAGTAGTDAACKVDASVASLASAALLLLLAPSVHASAPPGQAHDIMSCCWQKTLRWSLTDAYNVLAVARLGLAWLGLARLGLARLGLAAVVHKHEGVKLRVHNHP